MPGVLPEVLDALANDAIADVFSTVGITDTVTIKRATETSDNKGGRKQTWATVSNMADIGCSIKYSRFPIKSAITGEWITISGYKVTMPRARNGALINIKENDRLEVAARTYEPARTLKVVGIENVAGVVMKVHCEIENQV